MRIFTETTTKTEEVKLSTEEEKTGLPEKKREINPYLLALSLVVILCLGVFCSAALRSAREEEPKAPEAASAEVDYGLPDWMTPAFLTPDGESRSGEKLEAVRDLAVHYVANPGTSAMANRNYFEGPDSSSSSHFVVGLEGEVLALIPTDEKSCATNERNFDTISIEVCHPDESGKFSEATYESLIRLLAYLCNEFDLTEENLIRHYDVTGKLCPRYYVEHPEAWEALKEDVKEALAKGVSYDSKA